MHFGIFKPKCISLFKHEPTHCYSCKFINMPYNPFVYLNNSKKDFIQWIFYGLKETRTILLNICLRLYWIFDPNIKLIKTLNCLIEYDKQNKIVTIC